MSEARRISPSSGNVFADLGFADPEPEMVKAKLAQRLARIVAERGWTHARAAETMGIGQPKVSDLMRGRLDGFSTDRLIRLLTHLDQDVTITVAPRPASRARASVAVAIHLDPTEPPKDEMTASGTRANAGTGITS